MSNVLFSTGELSNIGDSAKPEANVDTEVAEVGREGMQGSKSPTSASVADVMLKNFRTSGVIGMPNTVFSAVKKDMV